MIITENNSTRRAIAQAVATLLQDPGVTELINDGNIPDPSSLLKQMIATRVADAGEFGSLESIEVNLLSGNDAFITAKVATTEASTTSGGIEVALSPLGLLTGEGARGQAHAAFVSLGVSVVPILFSDIPKLLDLLQRM